jgi:hypothetical protein
MTGEEIVQLVKEVIPIYTRKRPSAKGKTDCQITTHCKQTMRVAMITQLREGVDKETVVLKYKKLVAKFEQE